MVGLSGQQDMSVSDVYKFWVMHLGAWEGGSGYKADKDEVRSCRGEGSKMAVGWAEAPPTSSPGPNWCYHYIREQSS